MRRTVWLGWVGIALLTVVMTGAASAQEGGRQGWLGIYSQELDDALREGLDFEGEGVLVNRVVDDSPADRAGLRKGDIIISVGGRSVDSPDELARVIRGHESGDEVTLRIFRNGERRSLSAQLGKRPGSAAGDFDIEIDPDDAPRAPKAPKAPEAPAPPALPRFHVDLDGDGSRDVRIMRFPSRGRLGVRVEDLNEDLGGYFDAPERKGALVIEVVDDSPAQKAGIKSGDVITRVAGERIDDSEDLIKTLGEQHGRVSVEVSRRGEQRSFEVELEKTESWRSGPQAFEWRGGSDGFRRGTETPAPRTRMNADEERALRAELRALREELRRLKEELEELRER